jgi:hypothetical protein
MTLYMCDYDWSSGSFVFKQKQSHFHPNRSISPQGLVTIQVNILSMYKHIRYVYTLIV